MDAETLQTRRENEGKEELTANFLLENKLNNFNFQVVNSDCFPSKQIFLFLNQDLNHYFSKKQEILLNK